MRKFEKHLVEEPSLLKRWKKSQIAKHLILHKIHKIIK